MPKPHFRSREFACPHPWVEEAYAEYRRMLCVPALVGLAPAWHREYARRRAAWISFLKSENLYAAPHEQQCQAMTRFTCPERQRVSPRLKLTPKE